jgi:hypothetical protein
LIGAAKASGDEKEFEKLLQGPYSPLLLLQHVVEGIESKIQVEFLLI